MKKLMGSLLMGAALLIAGCSEKKETPATSTTGGDKAAAPAKVSIVLNWFPEVEHGGYYAALVEGYYAAEGLDVTVIPGGVDVSVVPRVATGQQEFGVCNADDLIMGRAAGAEVIALLAPMQTSPRVIMVHEDSGIDHLSKLQDITLAMGAGAGFAEFVRKKYPLTNVKIVPYPGSISVFLNDKKFAQQAYIIAEPFLAKKGGGNPRSLLVADYGYNPYTSLLIVSEEYLEENRDVVRRFTKASLAGWEKYMADPTKTNLHINKVNPEMGTDILAFGVEELKPLVHTEATKTGGLASMTLDRWKTLHDTMVDVGIIQAGKVNPAECFTSSFLPETKE